MGTNRKAGRAIIGATVCLALLAATIMGCSEPITTYQVSRQCLTGSEKVLVMPFMDTRTFVDPNDPHREDLSEHTREIFALAMRENRVGNDADILTPIMPKQDKSLTNGEIAEIGRMYGADVVVTGQVFSFTETRAASIPPRAGMFIRLISAKDGSLLFVGDHYQSAVIPGAGGGRDLQAKNVSERLVQGICSAIPAQVARRRVNSVGAGGALASLAITGAGIVANDNDNDDSGPAVDSDSLSFAPLPLSSATLETGRTAPLNPDEWGEQIAPELPPIITSSEDFYAMTGMDAVPLPPPSLEEVGMTEEEYAEVAETEPEPEIPAMAEAESFGNDDIEDMAEAEPFGNDDVEDMAEASGPADEEADAIAVAAPETEPEVPVSEIAGAVTEEQDFYTRWINSGYPYAEQGPVDVGDMARKTGDEMAADLFASEDAMLSEAFALRVSDHGGEQAEVMASAQTIHPAIIADEPGLPAVPARTEPEMMIEAEPYGYMLAMNDGPVISMPLAVEQPRAYRTVDLVLPEDATASRESAAPSMSRNDAYAQPNAIRVLLLPYHDRSNPNNLIPNTGGGEVVTTLYGTQLSQDPGVQLLWDSSGQATHDRLVDKDEAIQMGKMVNADFVIRGQVVEFRRAQSVPSFYSVMISTAVLAAQIFFAEMSGVDVATEVYRVSDGECIMSRRDRAQQKYVVQAEKTVRKLAAGMAISVAKVMKEPDPEIMDPLIDEIAPISLLGNMKFDEWFG